MFRKFLEAAKTADCAIELNTAGLRKDCREIYPSSRFLDLAFAVTYHTCQGQTMPRVVVDLCQANGGLLEVWGTLTLRHQALWSAAQSRSAPCTEAVLDVA